MRKILVVDDDEMSRLTMSKLLDQLGYDHQVVSSANECLAQLMSQPQAYSLVLMDVHMPHVTGLDASSYIRDINPDPRRSIPIIAVTGDSSLHDSDAVHKHGIDGVIAKPISLAGLDDAIRVHMEETA